MSEPKRRLFERPLLERPLLELRLFERRLFEHTSVTPTFIGAESVVVGNIRGTGQFVVSGEVHGDGELDGGLNLSVTGSWHGIVRARQAIIAGKITGGLEVEDKLEIGRTAVIRGRVSARTVAIAKGAIVDGEIEVTSGAPVVEFEDKRGRK
ncbi:MAG: polymer-forming cytoskeletal protein [Steroidobacteraceae bacterium]